LCPLHGAGQNAEQRATTGRDGPSSFSGPDGWCWPAISNSLNKLLLHMELDFNRRFHFHRFAVQDVRFVLPLFHGIHRSLDENWMP